MGYVRRTLGPHEKILYESKYHWSYTALGLALCVTIVGLPWGLGMLINRWTTEIVVTNARLVKKTGLIRRETEEVSLDRIEEVRLDQSILGRLLGFGSLTVRGTGEGVIELKMIDAPLALRRAVLSADHRPHRVDSRRPAPAAA